MSEVGCKLTKDMMVLPSMCDGASRLSIPACLDIFQNLATLHADNFDIGPAGMKRRNYFWVITKIRLHIEELPMMMDRIKANTWIQAADRASCERDFSITTEDGKVLAYGRSIWAVISHDTGKLIHMDELYPKLDFNVAPPDDRPFLKIGRKFNEEDPEVSTLGTYTVRSVDIDLGGHMNNVNYVRAMLGCFSSEELNGMNISEVELNYISQTYEGDEITFKCRKPDESRSAEDINLEIGAVNDEGKAVFIAALS